MTDWSAEFVFGEAPCRISVGAGLPGADLLCGSKLPPAAIVAFDANTESYGRSVAAEFEKSGCRAALVRMEAGERHKGWAAAEGLLEAAARAGLGRDGMFVGVGGGVVTDLVAFAASVYMRGARLALVPTTLLAMVDAAVGGKTGFDLLGLKNLVGTFKPAEAVSAPISALATLPVREWRSGLAEVVKTAVIADGELLAFLEANAAILAEGPAGDLAWMVRRCAQAKASIVAEDPEERGTRRVLLNLGHTFGHALEASAGLGTLTHGEAVAWGMARACALAGVLGTAGAARLERIVGLLSRLGYRTEARHPAAPDADALISAMAGDKKKVGGSLRFIVPTDDGAEIANGIGTSAIRSIL